MKFFLDANIPYSSKSVLSNLGHEVIHAKDVGMSFAEDKEIVEYAKSNKSIVITKDLDFGNPKSTQLLLIKELLF